MASNFLLDFSFSMLTILEDMEVGTFGEWIGALATLAAVILSLVLAWTNGRKARQESKLAIEDRHEFRRQQVEEGEHRKRRLAAQVTLVSDWRTEEWGRRRHYKIHNGGSEPIFDVVIVEHASDDEGADNKGLPRIVKTWDVIEARGNRDTVGTMRDFSASPVVGELVKPWNRSVQFNDGVGQRWKRLQTGDLQALEWKETKSLREAPQAPDDAPKKSPQS